MKNANGELPCGCDREHFCRKYRDLVTLADALYERWRETRDAEDWNKYLKVKERCDAHREGD